jgi:hypothetical protein
MGYRFTKLDEGKFFQETLKCGEDHIKCFYYVIRVLKHVVVSRRFLYIKGMFRLYSTDPNSNHWIDVFWRKRGKESRCWEFYIIDIDHISANIVQSYPLELVVLGYFRKPTKYLTKRQQQMMGTYE